MEVAEYEQEEEEEAMVDPMAHMAHMAHLGQMGQLQPMDMATQAVVNSQMGHLGLLNTWHGLDWQNLVVQAATAGLHMARGGRVRSQR
jgi:hypothetical protein